MSRRSRAGRSGRSWRLVCVPVEAPVGELGQRRSLGLVCAGMLLGLAVRVPAFLQSWLRGGRVRESDANFEALFAGSTVGLAVMKPGSGRIERANEHLCEILGLTAAELEAMNLTELIHPDDRQLTAATFRKLADAKTRLCFAARAVRKDGAEICGRITLIAVRDFDNRLVHALLEFRDVTASHRTEQELHTSQVNFRAMFELAGAGMATIAPPVGLFLRVNRKLCDITGYSEEELLERSILELTHPDDRPESAALYQRMLQAELPGYELEKRYLRKDGTIVWCHVSVTLVRGAEGEPLHSLGVVQDVTERHKAEEALRESEQTSRALVETAGVGIIRFEPQSGKILSGNRRACSMTGYSQPKLRKMSYFELLHSEEQRSAAYKEMYAPAHRRSERSAEWCYLREDGTRFWGSTDLTLTRSVDGGAVHALAVIQDTTERRHYEETLAEREAQLRLIGDSLPDGCIYQIELNPTDPSKSRFLYLSAGVERLSGVSREEGMKDSSVFYRMILQEDLPILLDAQVRAVQELQPYDLMVRFRHRTTGELRWSHLRAAPQKLPDGRVVLNGIHFDATQQRRTDEKFQQQAYMLELTHESVLAWELDGTITHWNRGAARLYGYSKEEAVGRRIYELLRSAFPEGREQMLSRLQQSGQWGGELQQVTRQGYAIVVESRMVLFHNPDGRTVVLESGHDITARRKAEDVLKEASRRKDEFLAMLGHELRNPLAAIRHALSMCDTDESTETFEWARGVVDRQSARLARLVNDLLDVSRINRGKVELRRERVDVATLLEHAIEAARPLISERRHRLATSFEPRALWVDGDPARLEQVLTNLLINSAKYTEPGGEIELSAALVDGGAPSGGGWVEISVRDNGSGIAPDKLGEMFDLFVQGERSLARSEGGLGLGLPIAKKLTEMHGGELTAYSAGAGRGSIFTVRLPRAIPRVEAATPARVPAPAQPAAKPHRVLVVDDVADAAQSLGKLLTRQGHTVEIADDGIIACEKAHRFAPEVVLLDIGMPGMNGYEVARCLRKDECCCHALLVAITGYGQEEDRRRALQAGFDEHLVKPVDIDFLKTLVGSAPELPNCCDASE